MYNAVLFDRALLTIGNITLLAGFMFLSGWMATLKFFSPIPLDFNFTGNWWHRSRATGLFWLGFALILMRWAFLGFVVEAAGLVLLFARFGKPVVRLLRSIPVISGVLALPGISVIVGLIDDTSTDRPKP
jgi:hypothetical protein